MSATRCTCVRSARTLVRLLVDPVCPAYTLHLLHDGSGKVPDRAADA